jgi:hypothetical protein
VIAALTRGWPSLERLDRFRDFRNRLAALPERVGPIDLSGLRDTTLPLPETWPDSSPPIASAEVGVPPEVDVGWLAAAFRASTAPPAARLQDIARLVRPLPEWTLTTIWLLECALAWPETEGIDRSTLLSELGDLYCQTGDVIQGVALLDEGRTLLGPGDPRSWTCDSRAAHWIARLNPAGAVERLRRLQEERAPAFVRLQAELELLGREIVNPRGEPTSETQALLERVRQADDVVQRGKEQGLTEEALRTLRVRSNHLSGRWLGMSRLRPLRVQGRDRLLEALHEAARWDDFRDLSRVLDALGRAHLRLGAVRHARESFEESIALKQKLRDLWGLGASLTGLAECLLAGGQPLESLPCFQVNLLLLEALGGMQVLFVRNLARHLNALVVAGCDPLEITPAAPDLLALAKELVERCTSFVVSAKDDPYCLLLDGGYNRLAARNAASDEERRRHVGEGVRQAESARRLFAGGGNWLRVAEASRTLAALLLDRAAGPGAGPDDLDNARRALEEADRHHQGEVGRVQAELLWARYHQLAGSPYPMQLHLAAARRAAEASGYQALAVGVDSRLGVQLIGPTGLVGSVRSTGGLDDGGEPDEMAVIAQPGETVDLEVRACDWRDRPLPASVLHGVIEPAAIPRTGEPGQKEGLCPTITLKQVRTDHLGRARFEIRAGLPSRSLFRVSTPDGVHSLSLRVVVQPVVIEWAADIHVRGDGSDSRLLLQLFGPNCARLRITRAFASGHSGTRVLLVEPFLRIPPGARQGTVADEDAEMRGQPCIVKLGPRSLLEDERKRYLRWVKDLLPVNISRLDGFIVWHDRAALRMSLVGDVSRGQVAELREWLGTATAFDAHLLLERVFVGDLAACWYGNSPQLRESQPVEKLYGPMVPCLLHLSDTSPPRGFTSLPEGHAARTVSLAEGLRHPAARSFRIGEEVVLADANLLGWKQVAQRNASGPVWEYELQSTHSPLRFTFRTPLSPELMEVDDPRDAGTARTVTGIVESTAHDRLHQTLSRCLEVFAASHPGESVTLSADERCLLVQTDQVCRRLPNPFDHLGRLLGEVLSCNWSLIHGDLHGRNILVGPQGQPFYIDFARTGYGPTLFDFLKFEVYLWHESFAGWPNTQQPPGCDLAQAMRLLEEFSSPDPARHFPSPYARHAGAEGRSRWPTLFRQCLATLRSAARPHVCRENGRDYFLPLALYTALMLRWCEPAGSEAEQKRLARQGVIHALSSASLLDGVLLSG